MKPKFIFALLIAISSLGAHVHAQDAAQHNQTLGDYAAAQDSANAPKPVPKPAPPPQAMVDMPVLNAPKALNDVIRAEDLTIQSFPEKRIRDDMIRDSTQVVGQAARRQLPAGQPLRLIDLQKEQIVRRGEDVALIFHDGSLEITASGKAQESGALGDSIKVLNLGSNRVIDARVTGSRRVEVTR